MSLRLVRPPEEGQVTRPPKGRRSAALVRSREESRNLRQALKNLRLRFGSWSCLAAVMGVPPGTLATVAACRGRGSAVIALRAARAAGSTVEAVLAGKLTPAGSCPHCGAKVAERRAS